MRETRTPFNSLSRDCLASGRRPMPLMNSIATLHNGNNWLPLFAATTRMAIQRGVLPLVVSIGMQFPSFRSSDISLPLPRNLGWALLGFKDIRMSSNHMSF